MSFKSEIESALEEIEGDLPEMTLTLPQGAVIPCVPSMEDMSSEIAIGAQIEGNVVVVRVRKSWFITSDLTTITSDSTVLLSDNDTPRLRSGKTPVFRGKTYRVLKSQEDPSGAYFKVFLGSAK